VIWAFLFYFIFLVCSPNVRPAHDCRRSATGSRARIQQSITHAARIPGEAGRGDEWGVKGEGGAFSVQGWKALWTLNTFDVAGGPRNHSCLGNGQMTLTVDARLTSSWQCEGAGHLCRHGLVLSFHV